MDLIVQIVSGIYSFLIGAGLLVLLAVAILIGFSVLALISSRMKTTTKKLGAKYGYFHVHPETTKFDPSTSFACRFKMGALAADPADTEGAEHLPALACQPQGKPIVVLKFEGDKLAAGRKGFANLIDEVIVNKDKFAGAVVVVSSPGGGVAEYGYMYSQMERIRNEGIHLTVCVDTYAASGGYLMSLPANRIIASPLSYVGSIGVVSEFLNFHDFLTALGIKPLTITAGEFKRTITPLSEVTEAGMAKYKEQLEAIHKLFGALVVRWRQGVDPAVVCTGQHWTAQEAFDLKLGLVDELGSPEDVLFKLNMERDLVYLTTKVNPFEKGILRLLTSLSDHVVDRIAARIGRHLS